MKVRIIKENKLREGGIPGVAKKLMKLLRLKEYKQIHAIIDSLSDEQIFDESEWETTRDFFETYLWDLKEADRVMAHNRKMAKKWKEIEAETKDRSPSQIQGLKDYVKMFTDNAEKDEAFIEPMLEIVKILADNLTKYGLDERVGLVSLKNWVPWAFSKEEQANEN